ncbi:MAG: hypothetical protein EP326_10840 [Deltaproteobacteria bacterium]|nr:MAG: hypothetical protein EP326_10840 [Deltaproteobacteria bacterium]TNF26427.1 MAG: hypothetical protein EP319_13950 [Deltaproteobacteria bacterium]
MKTLLIATLIVTGLGLTGIVGASEFQKPVGAFRVLSAHLDTFHVDKESRLSNLDIFAGNVMVDTARKQIHLSFDFTPDCPINAFCAQGHETITLPLVQTYTNVCGIKVYKALKDMMPVDGVKEELTVYDNSNNHCPTFAPLAETQVDFQTTWYNRIEGGLSSTFDRFEGDTLEFIYFPFN